MKRELPELLELGGKKKLLLGRSGDGGEPPVATSLNDARQQMQCATQNNHLGGLDTAQCPRCQLGIALNRAR